MRETSSMDGVHDLGGLAGFGPVEIEANEPVFHDDWERCVFRVNAAAITAGLLGGGQFRYSIERMAPDEYLSSSYYEHWLTGLATLLVERGMVSRQDLEQRAGGRFPLSGPDRATAPGEIGDDRAEPRFGIGDRVRVRELHAPGHTRAPRYIQGKRGVVTRLDGAFSVPDIEAHSDSRRVEPTYSVQFTAREIWGEGGSPGETVQVDLWESYLEGDQ
jgi:nitrile hydratase beta subunit